MHARTHTHKRTHARTHARTHIAHMCAEQKGDRMNYLVTCSFLEIYNERIFDLLDAGCTGKQLREDVKKGV